GPTVRTTPRRGSTAPTTHRRVRTTRTAPRERTTSRVRRAPLRPTIRRRRRRSTSRPTSTGLPITPVLRKVAAAGDRTARGTITQAAEAKRFAGWAAAGGAPGRPANEERGASAGVDLAAAEAGGE